MARFSSWPRAAARSPGWLPSTAPTVQTRASLIMDSSGNLYGTTLLEAPPMTARFSSWPKAAARSPRWLRSSAPTVNPRAGLIMDSSGNLYGTTALEAPQRRHGFRAGPRQRHDHHAGFVQRLQRNPYAGLIMDSSGDLYGTTSGAATNAARFSSWPTAAARSPGWLVQPHQRCSAVCGPDHGQQRQPVRHNGAWRPRQRGHGFRAASGRCTAALPDQWFSFLKLRRRPQTFTVTVQNADGTTDTGYTGTVHFTSTDSQAVLLANYTFTAAGAGKHDLSVTLKTAGTQSITATDTVTSGLTSSQTGITVNPAAARVLVITGPSTATAGVAFSITVTAYDAYGNIATGYTGTVHFKSTDNTAKLPANYT